MHLFKEYKKQISSYIADYLTSEQVKLKSINRWGEDVPSRLLSFVNAGKQIRGSLVLLSAEMYGQTAQSCLPLAAAMEFSQSGFLIHDDIMDNDEYRRGGKSLYFQYQELARSQNVSQSLRSGQSLGICMGDIAFFWTYDLINQLSCTNAVRQQLFSMSSAEYVKVALAQMDDVYFGFNSSEPSQDEILNVYRYKTARYTFSLPLMLGAVFAQSDPNQINQLSLLGEDLGILFQIKDDELGIFGEPQKTGKPVGSDITEGKKTLFRLFLMQASNTTEQEKLNSIFGSPEMQGRAAFCKNATRPGTQKHPVSLQLPPLKRKITHKKDISEQDILYIQNQIKAKGILHQIETLLTTLAEQAQEKIDLLTITPKYKNLLTELLKYSLNRNN